MTINHSRRRMLRVMAAAGLFAGSVLVTRRLPAADELPRLSEDSNQARALQYVHDAADAPADVRKENEYCHNCLYFRAEGDETWAKCDLFPGKLVNRDGWCNAWKAAD